ncbi:filament-like plant protein 4 [Selaginella moellendorffii]|nr:filament-like plant protein 4 [Selaginella moellendorffii]|eukprot:XP_002961065.2 filament-like plant protein 4 [Selaginella moellendorffii]
MERRSWLWKKKSSDKVAAAPDASDPSNDENHCSKLVQPEPVAISIPEGLQLDEVVKLLSERLAAAQCEVSEKDAVAKQHMKVAEEAVTGWEKSELEAATLKKQLEDALQKKVALEDRVAHLDNALKECVRQLRLVREEQEERLHETIARKTREWESLRSGLEGELLELRSQLSQSGSHANAVSKSLQERTMTILELNDCKVAAEMDARSTRARLESVEKEYAALKYDLQVLQRELEIRNEEREYSQKMMEASNRQQIENVKKTSRLEAECQRLRMLLKKKLPGPGALAQMRVEADPGESRRKGIAKPGKYCSEPADESSLDDKENDMSLDRLRAMEEETSLLKEILAKKNEELQDSRLQCVKTASKLSQLEDQVRVLKRAKPDEAAGGTDKLLESTNFDLMEDFIEMERLAANDKENVKRDSGRLEAALRAKEKEVRQANDVCAELRNKLAAVEKKLKGCHCRSATDGSLGKIQETVDLMFGLKSCKDKLSDTIDAESKARLRSSVGRIIHLVESMAQETSTLSSPELSSHGSDGGVKRLVAVSKNLLQGEVPVLDFIAELSCALDFVVGMSFNAGGRLESPSSSEQSRRSATDYVQEIHHLRSELAELESSLKSSTDTVKSLKIHLATVDEERCLLQKQLAATQDERKILQSEVGAVTALKNKLESRVNMADTEIRQVRQESARLAAELKEEQRRHQEVALKLQMLQQIPRHDESITIQKEQELIAAGEKLAECQRTIHALGKQLESLGLPPSSSHTTPARHFSRVSELPSATMESSDYIHKQETYWSSEGTPGFAARHQPGMISYSAPQAPEEIPLEVRTPARYYRKCKAAAAAAATKSYGNHGELSKSADMCSHSSEKHGGGVLGLGKFFSRAKANH